MNSRMGWIFIAVCALAGIAASLFIKTTAVQEQRAYKSVQPKKASSPTLLDAGATTGGLEGTSHLRALKRNIWTRRASTM